MDHRRLGPRCGVLGSCGAGLGSTVAVAATRRQLPALDWTLSRMASSGAGLRWFGGVGQEALPGVDGWGMATGVEDSARLDGRAGTLTGAGGRRRWFALALAWCAQAAGAAVFLGIPAIAPQFARRYGLGLPALGVALAALTLGAGVSVVPWGSLSDLIGERWVMVVGLVLAALALGVAAAVPVRTVVLGCLLVAGIGGASASAASSRTVLTWFGSSERGLAMGIRQTALPIGAAAAALGLPRLVSAWSVSGAIAALGAGCGVTAVVVSAGMGARQRQPPATDRQRRWLAPLAQPQLRRVVAASALLAVPQLALSSYMVVFLHDRRGWTVTDAAALLAAVQVAGAGLRPVVGRWSDRRQDRIRPMWISALIAAITLLILSATSASDGGLVVSMVAAAGIATLSWNGLAALAAGELAPSGATGLALGWQTSAVFFGGAVGGPAFAALVSVTSWSIGFAALAVPAIGAGLLVRPVIRQRRAQSESELLGRALASMSASISLIDVQDPDQPIVYINAAFERLTGYPAAEVLGRPWTLSEGPETDPETAALLHAAADNGQELRINVRHHRRDGTAYWSETLMAPVYQQDGSLTHYMSVQKDITTKIEAVQRASHMAYHDALTGLPNRAQLHDDLVLAVARAQRQGTSIAVLFLDLDGFKPVNDRFGHLAGDQLLRDAAHRWRSVGRDGETLARIGGDEFVLLLTDLPPKSARHGAEIAAGRCADTLRLPFDVHAAPGQTIEIGVSIGVAVYPDDSAAPEQLLLAADAAMYEAKRARRAGVHAHQRSAPER
jgi:diguanylate cyclase (GGDEF)-like protein/PAS domain S-box-containing protein